MEKSLVTFAVHASELTGWVGSPIFILNFALDRGVRQLVLLRGNFGSVSEQARLTVRNVPLSGHDLEVVNAWIAAEVASALQAAVGIRTELEVNGP